jgi:hypothetical protein
MKFALKRKTKTLKIGNHFENPHHECSVSKYLLPRKTNQTKKGKGPSQPQNPTLRVPSHQSQLPLSVPSAGGLMVGEDLATLSETGKIYR